MAQADSHNTKSPSRRAVLSGAAGAALATAAVPAVAAAVPFVEPDLNLPASVLARAEHVIGLLRSRHVCDGWALDEKAAERALQYFRRGCPDDEIEWLATLDFIDTHGQSLDWIFRGEPGVMICQAATQSMRAASTDPIFAAIEAHRAAYADFVATNLKQDRLDNALGGGNRANRPEDFTEADPPKWRAAVIANDAASDLEEAAAWVLVDAAPTTIAGAAALLHYAHEHSAAGKE